MICPPLKITFLGTGTSSGVPMIACPCRVCSSEDAKDKRLRSSILVESSTTTLVIDTTPDFRYQMLRNNVTKLDAVLFTHPHKDHIAGMDDIRAYNYFQNQAMNVYANELTQQALRKEFSYVFSESKYPGVPEVKLIDVHMEPFMVGDIPVIPFIVWHLKMPVVAFRFGDFTYITDANRIDDAEKQIIKGSKTIVLNALRHEKHISHFNLEEAVSLVKELDIPEAYFTHISHQLGKYKDISPILPPGIHLAYDELQLIFSPNTV
ncbi:MAG: MBL fold metallo-hydrolase [Bacteroidetes bacterium]|nr:MBL fold metallo-hydrolase [Bacteroidota bacterium]